MYSTVEDELSLDRIRRLAAGRISSSMLELALDLDLFARLGADRVPVEELAGRLEMPLPSTRMLAQFLCREGLLLREDGELRLSDVARRHLAVDSPHRQSLRKVLKLAIPPEHLRHRLFTPPVLHWYQLRDQGAIVDGSSMVGQKAEGWFSAFQSNNHGWRLQFGEELGRRYDFSRHRHFLDIGGGSGGWCIGLRRRYPDLRCTVFDLPEVGELALQSIRESGNEGEITYVAGSFFSDPLPSGADVALLANVLHNWTPEDDRVILGKVHDALAPGGTLLVHEYFFADDWTGLMEAVFEAFVLLGPEGKSGWQPSYAEMETLLTEAGFTDLERRQDLVLCRRPA
jgi:SAM-dependent methyltransferase